LDEAREIVAQPFPEEMRQIGFEHAKKSDVFAHRALLFERWGKVDASLPRVSEETKICRI
jgi:hypothetical protein